MSLLRSSQVAVSLICTVNRPSLVNCFLGEKVWIRTSTSNFSGTTSNFELHKESDDDVIRKTLNWVDKVIVGLNLCPFAEKSILQKQLFTTVVRGDDTEEIMAYVLYESILRQDDAGTTLVICPELHPLNFLDYYDVVCALEDLLQDKDLVDDVQIAPFHPLFQFEGSEQDTIGDYTNRSPYPIFHILREKEVSRAVSKIDYDSSKVWKRNVKLLEEMEREFGRNGTEKIIKGEISLDIEKLKELTRKIAEA